MIVMGTVMIAVGAIGIWESTVGNAGIAWAVAQWRGRRRDSSKDLQSVAMSQRPIKIDLLVPAHNEERIIQQTLTSLERAKELFSLRNSGTTGVRHSVQITVGLDHCTDRTERVIQSLLQRGSKIQVLRNFGAAGKWNILQQLVRNSQADWVGLVDAGSVWEEGLLSALLPRMLDPQTLAVAPAYRPVRAGLLEKLNWRLERLLKRLESVAGGPVSVHGATVFYRRETLLLAFDELKSENGWLNDDVVVPLTLRTLWPERKIHYATRDGDAWVRDYGIRVESKGQKSIEYGRRRRMLLGNLQWIRALNHKAWKADWLVGLIAARRVFRAFWAYWLLFLGLGTGCLLIELLQLSPLVLAFGVAGALALLLSRPVTRLMAAFRAGLELPYLWLTAARNAQEKIWN
jgi:glycosyltransferase involved in cell wall biosynthesis